MVQSFKRKTIFGKILGLIKVYSMHNFAHTSVCVCINNIGLNMGVAGVKAREAGGGRGQLIVEQRQKIRTKKNYFTILSVIISY